MKPIGRACIKKAEQLEADREQKAEHIFWSLVGVLCAVGAGGFIYAFARTLFAYFCE